MMPSIKKALGASRVDGWPRGLFIVVAEVGLEPTQPQWPKDFKSFVSTIPPFERGGGGGVCAGCGARGVRGGVLMVQS